jgi:hypothetical protein
MGHYADLVTACLRPVTSDGLLVHTSYVTGTLLFVDSGYTAI